jgi:hypothetical protein
VKGRFSGILDAAPGLLGISLVVVGGLKFTNRAGQSLADEFAWAAAWFLFVSIGVAYAGVRGAESRRWHAAAADAAFVLGLVSLMGSLTIAMFSF